MLLQLTAQKGHSIPGSHSLRLQVERTPAIFASACFLFSIFTYRKSVGVVEIEIYEHPPDNKASLARIRVPGYSSNISHILEVRSNSDGGMLIDFARRGQKVHASLSINRAGEFVTMYSPPPPPMGISENGMTRTKRGTLYMQSAIEIEGTAEGVRVQVMGTVDSAPRLVNSDFRNGPLMFFLFEEFPQNPDKPDPLEVWAVKTPNKQELRRAKLVKGTVIEVVLYKHTYEEVTIVGERITTTRYNLSKIISVKKPPKELKI
jgi:hypothetical protein